MRSRAVFSSTGGTAEDYEYGFVRITITLLILPENNQYTPSHEKCIHLGMWRKTAFPIHRFISKQIVLVVVTMAACV